MGRTLKFRLLIAVTCLVPASALAQWRCDCTTIVATCAAQVVARQSWIEVSSNTRQCSRVDYFVDGLPFVATVVDGESRIDWMSPRQNPDLRVQSCQVCTDNAAARSTESGAGDAAAVEDDSRLEPLIRWTAEYPADAQMRGVEGHATVEFDVNGAGTVDNAVVSESAPGTLFDDAALAAVRRWRYRADPERPVTHVTERIEFSLGDLILNLRPTANGSDSRAAAGRPRNECIREDALYDFGEMVEASLINACAEPLIVYGCAEGVGRQAGRWVCSASEQAGHALVRPGDDRVGTTLQRGSQPADLEWLDFTDGFYLARSPNSQYWWIACVAGDDACRQDARMWIRSTDRQSASIDPRGRTSVTVAGSY